MTVIAIGERPDAGRELAWVMADALADCGDFRSAVAHLRAAEGSAPLPEEYGRKCSAWEKQHGSLSPRVPLSVPI
jgi:hypothetical protein